MQCLKYVVKLDADGWPIPGTMEGKPDLQVTCDCSHTELTGSVMLVESGYKQVFHPKGLRFFYRFDCKGKIIPNSLFISRNHPGGNVLEYKKIVPDE